MLITKLSQSKLIRVLDGTTLYSILKKLNLDDAKKYTKGDLQKVAAGGGATHALTGSLMKAGPNIIITFSLQKPREGEVISSVPVECRGKEEIMSKVDEVATRIKSDLNLTQAQIAGDIDRNLVQISTPNAEAWAYYVEGRRYHSRGEYAKAIPLFQKALTLDPEFVYAHWNLVFAYLGVGDLAEFRRCSADLRELVQRHPERITERDRYLLDQDILFWGQPESEWRKPLEAGRKLLALYPDDPVGSRNQADIYCYIEEWDEALRLFEPYIAGHGRSVRSYQQMANAYRAKGEPAKGQEVLESYLREVENTAAGHRNLAYHHISQKRLDLAARELEAAETLGPGDYENLVLRADLLLSKGDLTGAEAAYLALRQEKMPMAVYAGTGGLVNSRMLEGRFEDGKKMMVRFVGQMRSTEVGLAESAARSGLAYILWRTGQPEAGIGECDKAYGIDSEVFDLDQKRQVLFLKGYIYLWLKRTVEAEKTAGELKAIIDKGLNKKAMRFHDLLMGGVEIARNNTSQGIGYLEKAVRALPFGPFEKDVRFLELLAEAYSRTGDLTRAREQYERITELSLLNLTYYDMYSRSFYQLGLIDDKLGDKASGRANYQKFLDLWKNDDPGRPEPADARRRLAAL